MATMGFAPAAAIGAKIGAPDKPVMCLVGDGGFLSVVGALTTSVELGIPVVWVIFNNFCFSTIRTVGTTYFNNAYGTEFTHAGRRALQPRLRACWRKAFGIEAARVEEPDDLPAALTTAIAVRRALHAGRLDPRRRADAAHRPLGHRGVPDLRQRLIGSHAPPRRRHLPSSDRATPAPFAAA